MARRGRPAKTQAQPVNLLPNSQTETLPLIRVDSVEPVVEDIIIPEVANHENNSHEGTKNTPAMQPSPDHISNNMNYRTMYIDSQKKVRSLMKKNERLRKDWKFALGKIEVYAEMTPILSSLSKANEILCNRPWSTRR